MSAPAFQSALARLIVDPDFRDSVRERDDEALAGDLSDLERERLLRVARDPGLEITRTLHKGFRLSKILSWLPLTCTVLGRDALARELGELWRRKLPVSFYYLEEAVAFCDFLLERCRCGIDVPYLEEIAAYERATLELQRARPDGESPEPQRVTFRHDPLPLLQALGRGEVPELVPDRPCVLLGSRESGRLQWRLVEEAPG